MIYLSEIIGSRVWDAWGNNLGKCSDVLISRSDAVFPPVSAIAVNSKDGSTFHVAANQISSLFPSIALKVAGTDLKPYTLGGNELLLKRQVLDHQIVDIEGKRVVRVNDIQLAYSQNIYVVTGVDVGNLGLARRLGFEKPVLAFSKLINRPVVQSVITWQDVAYLEEKNPLRLKKSKEKISKLPPADIALILSDLNRSAGQSLMENMDIEVLADTLEESPTKTQIDVLTHLDSHQAADILEEMEPDEAADLLADMPRETSHELLQLMEEDEAKEIRTLLHYPPDSAGGIMTTDYGWINDGLTVSQAIEFLRSSEEAQDVEEMYYIYVLDKEEHLRGVIYLRDLVMAKPDQLVETLMESKPAFVLPHTSQDEVAYLIAKYNLLSIPVVDETTSKMLGIVTLDDALDTVLPTAYKKRLPRFF
ncbi:MAG: CBS domain-containing protein [Anaerolineaceae bacterium]|nr:CBS domain-containing protein [Anaerolineaceae bacterium]